MLITVSTMDPSRAYLAAFCAIAGSFVGSLILFAIARKGGHALLAKYTEHGRGLKLRRWFERYGLVTIFIPAISPIPMPMKIPVFCAGALGVRFRSFLATVTPARVIRYLALAYLGKRYGSQTFPYLKAHWPIVLVLLLFLCGLALLMLRVIDREPSAPATIDSI